ncbi:DUF4157 domain-containing protein [Kitasatospora sp. NPDC089797]|uniref:eCIS core domain-containing protein n=1 Tax=Kitasatospora sp. NPDC089797 TaxID=3155298 RepID=UPI0034483738
MASARTAARAPGTASAAPASARGILALQASVGNTAVVQMMRRAGLLDGRQRHEHGAGCGHRQAAEGAAAVQRSAVHDVLATGGRPLDTATRTDMEARLGADFSDVRVHDDTAARASAAEVGARAYTSGSHIVIGAGGADKHTLAHELTHVIQQRQGPVAGTDNGDGLRVSDPSDRFEREAEANATRAMHRPVADRPASSPDPVEGARAGATAPPVQRLTLPPTTPITSTPLVGFDDRATRSSAGYARALDSEMITDGSLVGNTPQQNPPGWDYLQDLVRAGHLRQGNWIRFHLVNNIAGGHGAAENLVVASQSDNQRYESAYESQLKADVSAVRTHNAAAAPANHQYVYCGVSLSYHPHNATAGTGAQQAASDCFPESLRFVEYTLDRSQANPSWTLQKDATFNFASRQPVDPRLPVALSAMTFQELADYTRIATWTRPEYAFLQQIGTANSTAHNQFLAGSGGSAGLTVDDVEGGLAQAMFPVPAAAAPPGARRSTRATKPQEIPFNNVLDAQKIASLARAISQGSFTL